MMALFLDTFLLYLVILFVSLGQGVELRGQPVGIEPYHVVQGTELRLSGTKASRVQGCVLEHGA